MVPPRTPSRARSAPPRPPWRTVDEEGRHVMSVIIPGFNAEHVIGDAVASVIAQTDVDLELIDD